MVFSWLWLSYSSILGSLGHTQFNQPTIRSIDWPTSALDCQPIYRLPPLSLVGWPAGELSIGTFLIVSRSAELISHSQRRPGDNLQLLTGNSIIVCITNNKWNVILQISLDHTTDQTWEFSRRRSLEGCAALVGVETARLAGQTRLPAPHSLRYTGGRYTHIQARRHWLSCLQMKTRWGTERSKEVSYSVVIDVTELSLLSPGCAECLMGAGSQTSPGPQLRLTLASVVGL